MTRSCPECSFIQWLLFPWKFLWLQEGQETYCFVPVQFHVAYSQLLFTRYGNKNLVTLGGISLCIHRDTGNLFCFSQMTAHHLQLCPFSKTCARARIRGDAVLVRAVFNCCLHERQSGCLQGAEAVRMVLLGLFQTIKVNKDQCSPRRRGYVLITVCV